MDQRLSLTKVFLLEASTSKKTSHKAIHPHKKCVYKKNSPKSSTNAHLQEIPPKIEKLSPCMKFSPNASKTFPLDGAPKDPKISPC
jgi:hypothetical protein